MLSDVSIVITAGSRPGCLRKALFGLRGNLPEAKIVVVNDDGKIPQTVSGFSLTQGIIWREMPPDTFLTRKRNAGVALVDTKYTLLAADDFEFDIASRATVIHMAEQLDKLPYIDVIGGRVNNRPYEGFLTEVKGQHIKETRTTLTALHSVDLLANFFLARTKVLRRNLWDETIGPIGGEHADWFLDLKSTGEMVVWDPKVNINEQEKDPSKEAPEYRAMRQRAQLGHELFLKKRGVKRYYSFDEEVKP